MHAGLADGHAAAFEAAGFDNGKAVLALGSLRQRWLEYSAGDLAAEQADQHPYLVTLAAVGFDGGLGGGSRMAELLVFTELLGALCDPTAVE